MLHILSRKGKDHLKDGLSQFNCTRDVGLGSSCLANVHSPRPVRAPSVRWCGWIHRGISREGSLHAKLGNATANSTTISSPSAVLDISIYMPPR